MNELPEHDICGLVDGELDAPARGRLVDKLIQDRELQRQWTRYHLASDVMRSNLPDIVDKGFADRVSQAIIAEPAILAPRNRPREMPALVKRFAGMAVAASVAAVAVLGVQSMYQEEGAGNVLVAEMPAASEYVRIAPAQPAVQPQAHPRLDRYLVNHHQHSVTVPIQGAMPYARIVAYPGQRTGSEQQ